ncbi:hypothetical protein D9611_014508 [Ephemerocybe angulata]|uniref:Fungal-type protein kinase domain-containing protein n=1 Tax=Ephemerocybe angulata TaxID=980116 RepID=A0A8H5C569_9AGAR|nr:hypothetical protein D9611_014508 [Tulosesus angulatus]
MNGDARRMFLYGITIESDRVSVWYFSRNHSVKADSFSFVKHPERLIHLFVSLFSANDEALGLDPNIVLYPKESSGNPSYIYRFSNGSVDECRLFKTTEAIGDHTGSLRVSGHTTRVWKAVEVANIDGDPLTGTGDGMKAEGVVIKDVWIDATAETEKEIQDKIFKSINEFVESPEPWKGHPCLAKFTPLQFADLESLIVDKQYRKCFLRIRETHQSQPSKAVAKDSWMHDDPFTVSETPQTAIPPQLPSTLGATNLVQSAPDNVNGRIEARYPPKKRCFFMFDEICTRVSHLPTFGDAVDILRQTYTVLLLMFCAGWIHRDISTGNILAMEGKQGKWLLKLADLEYAEPFPATVPPGRENWRIGTPFFMATELQRGHYFTLTKAAEDQDPSYLETEVQNSSADPETNVVHNLQHDLESLWWIGFYLGTVKVGPNLQSALWCRDMGIFCGHLEANPDSRHQLLLRGFPKELQETFHPGLKMFMALWRKLGNNMMASYQRRSPGDVTDKSTYAHISWHFVMFLDALEDSRNQWGPVPLLIPGARESKKRARREKAEEEEDDKGVRSHADPSRTSDIGPSMKRPRVSDNEL